MFAKQVRIFEHNADDAITITTAGALMTTTTDDAIVITDDDALTTIITDDALVIGL